MIIRSVWSFGQSDYASQHPNYISSIMGYQKSAKIVSLKARINKALDALRRAEFTLIYAAAETYNLAITTLRRRFNQQDQQNLQIQARQFGSLFTNAEESTFVR